MSRHAPLLIALALASCTNPGERPVAVFVEAHGTAVAPFVDGAYTVTIVRADVSFGPAYFCATEEASTDACATAVVSTTEAIAFDALDPAAQPLATLFGFEGTVRTVQYDMGLPFLLTEDAPTAQTGAVEGHSVVLEGTASDGVSTFAFTFALDVVSSEPGSTAVIGLPTVATLVSGAHHLDVAVDPRAWLEGVDWAALAAMPHAPGEPVVVPAGSAESVRVIDAMTVAHPPTFAWPPP